MYNRIEKWEGVHGRRDGSEGKGPNEKGQKERGGDETQEYHAQTPATLE